MTHAAHIVPGWDPVTGNYTAQFSSIAGLGEVTGETREDLEHAVVTALTTNGFASGKHERPDQVVIAYADQPTVLAL